MGTDSGSAIASGRSRPSPEPQVSSEVLGLRGRIGGHTALDLTATAEAGRIPAVRTNVSSHSLEDPQSGSTREGT